MARRARLDLTTPSLLGLPLAWLAVFFVVPMVCCLTCIRNVPLRLVPLCCWKATWC